VAIRRSPYLRNRTAWRAYNEHRVKRAYEINPDAAKIAFEIVPFLLNANTPGLPGYVDTLEPVGGVARYLAADKHERFTARDWRFATDFVRLGRPSAGTFQGS